MSLETDEETRSRTGWWYPIDLAFVSVAVIVGYLIVTTLASGSAVRLIAAVPLLFFLPGYAIVALCFPANERRVRPEGTGRERSRPAGIDTTERLGLSVALSIAVIPVLVVALPLTNWGLDPDVAAATLAVVTIVVAQLAAIRRARLSDRDRFRVAPGRTLTTLRGSEQSASIARVSSIVLVVTMVLAGLVVIVALSSPLSAAQYTEIGLYSEDEDEYDVDADLPSTVEPGESIPLAVGVENQEGEEKTYTVVVQEQRLEGDEVVDRTELLRIDYRVSDGGTAYGDRTITPTADEGAVRISFLLYETVDGDDSDLPSIPTNENADDDVYFWTTVADSATGTADDEDAAGGTDATDDFGTGADEADDDGGFPFDFGGIFDG